MQLARVISEADCSAGGIKKAFGNAHNEMRQIKLRIVQEMRMTRTRDVVLPPMSSQRLSKFLGEANQLSQLMNGLHLNGGGGMPQLAMGGSGNRNQSPSRHGGGNRNESPARNGGGNRGHNPGRSQSRGRRSSRG